MATFGAISYAILAALYTLLAILLLTNWRGPKVGVFLIGACLLTALWGGLLGWRIAGGPSSVEILFLAEVLRTGAWLAFLAQAGPSPFVRRLANTSWILVLLAGGWVMVSNWLLGTVGSLQPILIFGGLGLSLVGLVTLEQLYRNAPATSRASFKALVVGLGGIFAFDLFLYSQGVLFQEIDEATAMARGAVNVLCVPLIALAARRNPVWDLSIFVSRQVVFYTTTLIAVGLYLLLMSLGGYLLLALGGQWGGVARVIFLAGAGLVLAALLISSTMRARVKVFLSKHFFENRYDYREEWLRLVSTLAAFDDSSTRQVVIQALAQIVDSPSGTLWTKSPTSDAYMVAARYGETDDAGDLPVDCELVDFVTAEGWIVDLQEFRQHPERYADLELPEWLRDRNDAWLIIPLLTRSSLQGLILLNHGSLYRELNYEDRDLLKTVGNHIAVHLAQERSDTLLSEAKQFEAFNRLTAFLMHDLKNLIAQQSLIIENAERHKRNPDFIDDAIETISGGVARMKRVIDHLRQSSLTQPVEKIDLGKLVLKAVSTCGDRAPTPIAKIGEEEVWIVGDPDRLKMALDHAIRNAQDATGDDGRVDVRLTRDRGFAQLEITDSGSGMDQEFLRNRLFRPFDSTKGSQGVGIGAYQILETVRSVGGTVTVQSAPGDGTRMIWRLPASH